MAMQRAKKVAIAGFVVGIAGLVIVVAGIVMSRRYEFAPDALFLWAIGGLLFFAGLSVFARGIAGLRSTMTGRSGP